MKFYFSFTLLKFLVVSISHAHKDKITSITATAKEQPQVQLRRDDFLCTVDDGANLQVSIATFSWTSG